MKKKLLQRISQLMSLPKLALYFFGILSFIMLIIFLFFLQAKVIKDVEKSYEADNFQETKEGQETNSANCTIPELNVDKDVIKEATDIANSIVAAKPSSEIEAMLLEAQEQYLSGKWNGDFPITLHEHEISISEDYGIILFDGSAEDLYINNGDIPSSYRIKDTRAPYGDQGSSIAFIPGEGSYMVIDGALTKFQKGTKTLLEGGKIKFSGFDTVNFMPYYFELKYDSFSDTLFVIVYIDPKEITDDTFLYPASGHGDFETVSDSKIEAEMGMYLYRFPDYNVSNVEFVDKIIDFDIDESGMRYIDTNHVLWEYDTNSKDYSFKKTKQTSLWMVPPRSNLVVSDKACAKRIYKDLRKGVFSVEINGKTIGNMGEDLIWYYYVKNSDSFFFMLKNSPGVVYSADVNSKELYKSLIGTCDYVLDHYYGWMLVN